MRSARIQNTCYECFEQLQKFLQVLLNYTFNEDIVVQIHCATQYKRLPSIPSQYGYPTERKSSHVWLLRTSKFHHQACIVCKQNSSHLHSLCVYAWVFFCTAVGIQNFATLYSENETWWWTLLVWCKHVSGLFCSRRVSLNLTATRDDAISIDDFYGEVQTGKNCWWLI